MEHDAYVALVTEAKFCLEYYFTRFPRLLNVVNNLEDDVLLAEFEHVADATFGDCVRYFLFKYLHMGFSRSDLDRKSADEALDQDEDYDFANKSRIIDNLRAIPIACRLRKLGLLEDRVKFDHDYIRDYIQLSRALIVDPQQTLLKHSVTDFYADVTPIRAPDSWIIRSFAPAGDVIVDMESLAWYTLMDSVDFAGSVVVDSMFTVHTDGFYKTFKCPITQTPLYIVDTDNVRSILAKDASPSPPCTPELYLMCGYINNNLEFNVTSQGAVVCTPFPRLCLSNRAPFNNITVMCDVILQAFPRWLAECPYTSFFVHSKYHLFAYIYKVLTYGLNQLSYTIPDISLNDLCRTWKSSVRLLDNFYVRYKEISVWALAEPAMAINADVPVRAIDVLNTVERARLEYCPADGYKRYQYYAAIPYTNNRPALVKTEAVMRAYYPPIRWLFRLTREVVPCGAATQAATLGLVGFRRVEFYILLPQLIPHVTFAFYDSGDGFAGSCARAKDRLPSTDYIFDDTRYAKTGNRNKLRARIKKISERGYVGGVIRVAVTIGDPGDGLLRELMILRAMYKEVKLFGTTALDGPEYLVAFRGRRASWDVETDLYVNFARTYRTFVSAKFITMMYAACWIKFCVSNFYLGPLNIVREDDGSIVRPLFTSALRVLGWTRNKYLVSTTDLYL